MLQHSGADILASALPGDWPVAVGVEPDGADNAVTVYDTTPVPQHRTQNDGSVHFIWGFSLRVRATSYPVGWAKAAGLADFVTKQLRLTPVAVESGEYLIHGASVQGFQYIGRDSKSGRLLFTVNGSVTITGSEADAASVGHYFPARYFG